jgi:valyl-tRNA synthetase
VLGLGETTIQFEPPPKPFALDMNDSADRVTLVYQTIQAGRNLRSESRVASNKKSKFVLKPTHPWIEPELPTIARLLNASEVVLDAKFQPAAGVPVASTPLGELHLLLEIENKEAELERLEKEIARIEEELRTVGRKLANSSFVDRAPAAVVEEHRRRQSDFAAQLAQMTRARDALR